MAQPGNEPTYFRAFQFLVEIDKISQASFQEASGIDAATDLIEYREGGQRLGMRKLPGQVKHSNLVLKRGYTDDTQLWDWYQSVMNGGDDIRRNISVVQLDMTGQEKFRWNLYDAFPTKYTGAAFNAKGNDLAIESLEIAYERIERG